MDPALQELIESTPENQDVEVILKLSDAHQFPPGVKIIAQFGNIVTCRIRRESIEDVWSSELVRSVKASRYLEGEPAAEFDQVTNTKALEENNPFDRKVTGKGVVIAILDWGCDFAHPNFRNQDGSTRLLALWDQSGVSKSPNRYGYGQIYTRDEINRALATREPYASLGYHPAKSDPLGNGSHGTAVMDIAAGNGLAGSSPIGVAPEADLIFVHLDAARGTSGLLANLGDSVRLLEALDFVSRTAGEQPWVVNLSLGRTGGEHTGKSLVEQGMDELLSAAPGRAIVQSTGNYYLTRTHASDRLLPNQKCTLGWLVSPSDITPNELEIWYPGGDRFLVTLRPPNTNLSFTAALGEQVKLEIDGHEFGRLYHRAQDPNNFDNHIDIFLDRDAPSGRWQVTLLGEDVVDGRFHAWIERDFGSANQSRFELADAVSSHTTNTICNGRRTLAVGAYDQNTLERRVAPFSSAGPTRDGRLKPDILAPGVAIVAARSSPKGSLPAIESPTIKTGTSFAAPHVTGAIALLFSAVAPRKLSITETRNLILSSADRTQQEPWRVGNGYLNINQMLAMAQRYKISTKQIEQELKMNSQDIDLEKGVDLTEEFDSNSSNNEIFNDLEDIDIKSENIAEQSPPWNAYVYIVGTDESGKSDFNVMRRLLQKETTRIYPWVIITYDFKKGESDPKLGQIRKTWKQNASSNGRNEQFSLGESFSVIYHDIEGMAANNIQIKQLHFLTHFSDDAIWYRPQTNSSTSDLATLNQRKFSSAFASDALIKIHGCQLDFDILKLIKEFCQSAAKTRRIDILKAIRTRIERSYPYQLAKLIGQNVWATPLGAYASYECSYLTKAEQGKRFCVEIPRFQRTIRFYQANYDQIFARLAIKVFGNYYPYEVIFDSTYHLKYKPKLIHLTSFAPSDCASKVPPRTSTEDILSFEAVEPDLEPQLKPTIAQIETNLLSESLNLSKSINPVQLYDSLQFGKFPSSESVELDVIGYPGETLDQPLQEGDIMVRRAWGEPNLGYVAVVAEANLWSKEEIARAGLTPEGDRPGSYARIIDQGLSSHTYEDAFARLILDRYQRVPPYQMLLRPKNLYAAQASETDEQNDPCIGGYGQLGVKQREIHLNLGLDAVRVYFRTKSGFRHEEFSNIITGPVTRDLARSAGWCHMHPIGAKLEGPTPRHGLTNFVVFCLRREIGFHSDHHIDNGKKVRIPGNISAGCARIPDDKSQRFFDLVQIGDCVRIYDRQFWRSPTFARCTQSDRCKRDT